MSQITNHIEFKQAYIELDVEQQRELSAQFCEYGLPLSTEGRMRQHTPGGSKGGCV